MLNGRLYRLAFVPFVIALAIAAFSLGGRPAGMGSTLSPEAFEGQRAMRTLDYMASHFASRRAGSHGDEALAGWVAARLRAFGSPSGGGYAVRTIQTGGQTIDGQRTLTDVIARRAGATDEAPILIVAHRDAAHSGARAQLTGTAALLELAQVLASRQTTRTIVLASTSGGSGGDEAAAALPSELPGPFDAVVVLGDLGGSHLRQPLVTPYSDGLGSAPLLLQRTVASAISQEAGVASASPSTLATLSHLIFPLATGEQGVLQARGLPAVLVGVGGEGEPPAGEGVDAERLELFGRGVLSSIDALDAGPDVPTAADTGLPVGHKLLPEWAVTLLVITLLLPVLLAGVDGLARMRRRRLAAGRWMLWALSCALPFLGCAIVCRLLGVAGVIGAAPSAPVGGGAIPLHGGAIAVLVALLLTLVVAWALWAVLMRRLQWRERPEGDTLAVPVVLTVAAVAVIVCAGNPYTALLLVPAAHLWLLLAEPRLRPGRVLSALVVALGLAPLGLLFAYYASQLGLGLTGTAWSAVLMVAGGHVGLGSALLWSLALGSAVAAARVAFARAPVAGLEAVPAREVPITIRGPLGYAGPGSLGGTESALRR